MRMEATTDTSPEQRLMAAVRDYIGRGWRVIPLHTPKPDGTCTCGKRECGAIGKHPRTRNGLKDSTSRVPVAQEWWRKWPRANIGIVTGGKSGLLALDIDTRHGGYDSLATLQERYGPLPSTLTALTGGGGEHRLYAHPGGDLLLRNVAGLDGLAGLDVRGDGGYIVAAPSLHSSGAYYDWQDAATAIAPLPEWLLSLLTKPRGGADTVHSPSLDAPAAHMAHDQRYVSEDRDADARYWLERYIGSAREGSRNTTGVYLARQLRDSVRLTESEAEPYMMEYAERVPGSGYSVREALATLRSIYREPAGEPARNLSRTFPDTPYTSNGSQAAITEYPGHAPYADATALPAYDVLASDELEATPERTGRHSADTTAGRAQKPRSRFQFMTDVEVERLPAPEWLIYGMLPAARLAVVYGEYGSGKSFLTLGMGLSIAAGRPWMGKTVRQGAVVYIAGEGLGGLGKRIKAWKIANHVNDGLPFHVLGVAPQLLQQGDVGQLGAAIASLPEPPAVIFLDTLARSMVGGDENSQKDMGQAVAACDYLRDTFNATVILVHHKPNAGNGTSNGRTRGSSALPGAADTLIDVTKDGTLITVSCAKQKDAAPFGRLYLDMRTYSLDSNGKETSCVLVPREKRYGDAEPKADIMLRILEAHPSGLYHADWKQQASERGVSASTFNYQLNALEKASRITNYGGLWMIASPSPS